MTVANAHKECNSQASGRSGSAGGLVPSYYEGLRIRNYSPRTISSYICGLRAFIRYFHPIHPRELDTDQVRRYLLYLLDERKLSYSSVNQAVNAIRFLYRTLYNRAWVMEPIPRPRRTRTLPEVLSRTEVLAIIGAAEDARERLMIQLQYAAGLRVSELVNLRIQDINLENLTLFVRDGKGHKDRITIFAESLREPLQRLMKDRAREAPLFVSSRKAGAICSRTVQRNFRRALLASGVKKDVKSHALRHSFATHLLENGVDVCYIQELLGHTRVETTRLYARVRNPGLFNIRSPL